MNRLVKILLGFLLVLSFTTTSYARDQIKIVGSSTVYPYATVVAEKFGKGGKFKTPVIESTGTWWRNEIILRRCRSKSS